MIGKHRVAAKRAEGTSLRSDVLHTIDYQRFAWFDVKCVFRVKLIVRAMQCRTFLFGPHCFPSFGDVAEDILGYVVPIMAVADEMIIIT